jgi:hypothetical protein
MDAAHRAKFSTVGAMQQFFINHKKRLRRMKELGVI